MVVVLPLPDADYDNGMQLMKRLWVARHESDEENTKLADKSVFH